MEAAIVTNTLTLIAQISLGILAAALVGGLIAGLVRVITGIEEDIVGVTMRTIAILGFVYFYAETGWNVLSDFTTRVWDGPDTYFIVK